MRKILKYTFYTLFFFTVCSYFMSAPQGDFKELYPIEDKASKSLLEFRERPIKSINVNDISWSYYSGGKGDKTILFLHGMGGAYDLWWQQVNAFENDYKVITFSLPEDIKSLEGVHQGIQEILLKEGVDKFYVVGTSMGGYIAQYLVEMMPERIEKVVFGNTFPPNDYIKEKKVILAKVIPLLPEILISKIGEKQLKNKLVPAANNSKLLAAFLPSLPFSKKQFVNRFKVVIDKFVAHPGNYKSLRIPKLIIEADNDPLVDEILRENLKILHSDAEVVTFHNEGHFPYVNIPNKYNVALKTFFERESSFKQVEKTLHNYFEGRRNADVNLLKSVFADEAMLYTVMNDNVLNISLDQYLEKVLVDGPQKVITSILDGEIFRDMARFNTQFKYNDKIYNDYLTLLKTDNKWKIVTKTFKKK